MRTVEDDRGQYPAHFEEEAGGHGAREGASRGCEIDTRAPLRVVWIVLSVPGSGTVHCRRGVWIEQRQFCANAPAAAVAPTGATAATTTTAATTRNICLGQSVDSYGHDWPNPAVLRFRAQYQQHRGYLDGEGAGR